MRNVRITEQFVCDGSQCSGLQSLKTVEKHWHRHSDGRVTIHLVLPFWHVTADWEYDVISLKSPEAMWAYVGT
jgi:hypothetical protein